MEPDKYIDKQGKRKKDKHRDNEDYGKDRRTKRARTRSQSPRPTRANDSNRKRKLSTSRSPDPQVKNESQIDANPPRVRKAKDIDMLNTRTGGAYIPPARLRMMQAQITDKSSMAYQRLAWEALKKSIHGHINKINVGNIGIIIKELLKENIVRGRGLLCRSVIQAQAASPTFTNVYAALVSAINSRFPNIGELLLKRLVIQFKRGFKRNDKPTCISSASFIAHLVNQRVAHEILALELLTLLVETPTDDSVEVAIAFLKESGQKLTEVSSKGVNAIFEMLRNILHEGQLDKRVQYMIEVMFQVWKDGFKDHPALLEELELVPEEEQFTHLLMLDDATDPQDILNVFKLDEKYEENEMKYKTLSKEILGSDAESGEEDHSEGSGDEEDDEDEEAEEQQKAVTIIDNTETNLVALRRTIYLTINSSLDFEECAHKLLKMELKPGQEVELCHMFLDCCAEQRTYEKFYGLLAQRFCNINRIYIGPFEEIFKDSYSTAHRLDTNRLRNVSKFFAHLLFTDSISWEVLECVKLNEEDTTSSSRIYIKILFQELAEYMGLKKLNDRLKDPTLQGAFLGIFPRDNPKNTRFSINFFTSIGLGGLTDELREHLKQMPKNVPAPITEINLGSDSSSSDSSSSSSDSSSDSSSSDSENDSDQEKSKKADKKKRKDKQSETPTGDQDKTQNGEKWGHDGFYETYGQEARRVDTRSDRREREDNFARPRDVQKRNDDRDKHRENYYEQRSRDDNRKRTEDRSRNNEFTKSNRDERTDRRREETMRSRGREDGSRSRDVVDKHHRDQSREDGSRSRDVVDKHHRDQSREDGSRSRDVVDKHHRDQNREDGSRSRDVVDKHHRDQNREDGSRSRDVVDKHHRDQSREDGSRSRDVVDKHHRDQSREDRNTERDIRSRQDNDKEMRRNRDESKYTRNKGDANERGSRAKKINKDGQDSNREPISEPNNESRKENEYVRYYDREITAKDYDNYRENCDDRDLDRQRPRIPKEDEHKRYKIGYKRDDNHIKKREEKGSKKNPVSSDEENDTSGRYDRGGGGGESRDRKEKKQDVVNRKQKAYSDESDEDNSSKGREKREYERDVRKNRSDKGDRRKSKDSSDGDEDRRTHRDSRKMRKDVTSYSKRDETRRQEHEDSSDEGSKKKRDKSRKKKSGKERLDGWDIESIKSSKKKEFGSRYWAGATPTKA